MYRRLLLARDVRILIIEGSQKSIGFRIMNSSLMGRRACCCLKRFQDLKVMGWML